ncbi:hypothetical protein A5635_06790 [Mycobacterium asiaticum]|uniref:DUF559 domain-containing protein n=1 Tax=Mycobacterium asiaticum TaxID=1790 RepID=A0A1A3N5H8_MYCAS|nr:hypothetical protein A5635_06790 [Mycobacterium asiaticum]
MRFGSWIAVSVTQHTSTMTAPFTGIKVAAEYDGDHHLTNRYHVRKDIRRHEKVTHSYGWIVVRVLAGDHPTDIIDRVRQARLARGVHDKLTNQTTLLNPRPKIAARFGSRPEKAR